MRDSDKPLSQLAQDLGVSPIDLELALASEPHTAEWRAGR
jgi:hypothetical protein